MKKEKVQLKTKNKKFLPIIVSLALVFAIVVIGIKLFKPEPISEELKLKVPTNKILSSQVLEIEDKTSGNKEEIVKYKYVSDEEVPEETFEGLKEDISKRTANAQFFKKGEFEENDQTKEEWVGKFYVGEPFYKDNKTGKWYQTEKAATSLSAWQKQTKLTFFEKLLGKKVFAATYYVGAGDGQVYMGTALYTWVAAHDALAGDGSSANLDGTTIRYTRTGTNQNRLWRSFFPVDTSAIPNTATIAAATFSAFPHGDSSYFNQLTDGGMNYTIVVQTSQANSTTLVTDDYDQMGTASGSSSIGYGSFVSDSYSTWTLNTTGLTWIKKSGEAANCGTTAGVTCLGLREGHDFENIESTLTTHNLIEFYASEIASVSVQPYLSVTYYTTPVAIKIKGGTINIKGGTINIK